MTGLGRSRICLQFVQIQRLSVMQDLHPILPEGEGRDGGKFIRPLRVHGEDPLGVHGINQFGDGLHIGVAAGVQGFVRMTADEAQQVFVGVLLLQISLPHGIDDLSVLVQEFLP